MLDTRFVISQFFFKKEQLSEEDPWYCSQCKEHRRAFKKFDLWKLPKILIIQLKRFSYRNKHWREKIETQVQFPLEGLDLTEHVLGPITKGEEPIYDLYAISNHYGGERRKEERKVC
jgi:ubiquitin carboxyl-terminal hydrolase 4/11/15